MSVIGPAYPFCKSTGVCAATGRAFAPGEACVAALVERAGDGHARAIVRVDYSLDAWHAGQGPSPSILVGMWRTVFQPPHPGKPKLMEDDELLDVFEGTSLAKDDKQLQFRYVLALLLIRRRLLRVVASKRDGEGVVMTVCRRGEPSDTASTRVVDPGMDEGAIAEAIEQLGAMIDGGADPAPVAVA
jgi:hypothetical protein